MLKLSIGLSGGSGVAGIPGFVVALSPLTNGTSTATVSSVPPGWTDIEWSVTGDPVFTLASMPTVDTSPDPVVVASATLSGGTWTIVVTSPAHYAAGSPYTVTEAQLAAGPHQLLAASVVEAPTGTYTATPGLWAFPADDPPLFTYEWRAGSTVFDASDGVAAGSLVFTPDAGAALSITGDGLDFVETAANGANTVSETLAVTEPVVIEAIRYAPARVGGIRISSTPAATRRYAVAGRFRLSSGWAAFGHVYRIQSRQMVQISPARRLIAEARAEGATGYTGSLGQTADGFLSTGVWYSFIMAADMDRGITGGRTWALVINNAVALGTTTDISGLQPFSGQCIPQNWGHEVTTSAPTTPINIFNGDFAPFAAFWRDTIPDPADPVVWAELFDTANGHAIRPEYLNGTKQTVAGIAPKSILRGVGMLNGVSDIAGGDTWSQFGTLQEIIYA